MSLKRSNFTLHDIIILATLANIIFIFEYALAFLPNIQLTVLLLILYSKVLNLKKAIIVLTVYFILDMLVYGGLLIAYIPFMYIGWLIIPISLNTVFKKVEDSFKLALLAILFSFLYSWVFIIPSVFIFNIPFLGYLIADIPFELTLASSSYLSVIFLYDPLKRLFKHLNIN
jgi:energy-coupling factor transport system substrate-specific component